VRGQVRRIELVFLPLFAALIAFGLAGGETFLVVAGAFGLLCSVPFRLISASQQRKMRRSLEATRASGALPPGSTGA
jgi:hypothetical protein